MITLSWQLYKLDIKGDCVFSWSYSFCCCQYWKIFLYSKWLFQSQAISGFTSWMGWKASCNKTRLALPPWPTGMRLWMSLEGIWPFGVVPVVTCKENPNIFVCGLKRKRCFLPVLAIPFKHLSTLLLKHLYFKHSRSWKRINSHQLKKRDKFCTVTSFFVQGEKIVHTWFWWGSARLSQTKY